jgi:hypothetical protein
VVPASDGILAAFSIIRVLQGSTWYMERLAAI